MKSQTGNDQSDLMDPTGKSKRSLTNRLSKFRALSTSVLVETLTYPNCCTFCLKVSSNSTVANLNSRREAAKHHSYFVCSRCYTPFESKNEHEKHKATGQNCEPHCISPSCSRRSQMAAPVPPSELKHKRLETCPPNKMVPAKERWQYFHHLQYPERGLMEPGKFFLAEEASQY